jgi:uncharacterized membrane protein YcaP (DUF421 family)
MIKYVILIFGQGHDLTPWQMGSRAFVVFFAALLLNRIAGKRAFGLRSPFDNVIVLLLGAILSRAIVGASPFFSTLTACLVLVVLHRLMGWLSCRSPRFESLVKGNKKLLYRTGTYERQIMQSQYITEKDLLEEVRINANVESMERVKEVHLERNGEISVVKLE